MVRVPCVVGKSMAITRAALRAIGGFAAFANVLAEDQAIGLAVRDAGYRVALSPVVVRNVLPIETIANSSTPVHDYVAVLTPVGQLAVIAAKLVSESKMLFKALPPELRRVACAWIK